MDLILDIFNNDAFTNVSLTAFVNQSFPFLPGYLSQLGLFTGDGAYTIDIALEEQTGVVRMIQTGPRGAPPSQVAHQKAGMRTARTRSLKREVEINADELLNVRAVGGLTLQTAQTLIDQRVNGPVGVKSDLAVTMEHMYLGCIDGQVYDADGTTLLWDWFIFYGVARPSAVNIPFSTMADDTAILRTAITQIKRQQVKALIGFATGAARPIALCGDNFFDALLGCKEVVTALKLSAFGAVNAPALLSSDLAYDSFTFGGVLWVNYRGLDDGTVSVPTNEARLFLAGVPGLFQTLYAPADTFETISQVGLPFYLLQRPERQTSSQRVFELQCNPLVTCLRPASLLRLTKS